MPQLGKKIGVVVALCGGLLLGSPAALVAARAPVAATALPHQGEHSLTVARLQQLLQRAGIEVPGGVDGLYGPSTATAVSAFQRARGLPASGVVDEATAIALGMTSATAVLATGAHGDAVRVVQQQLAAAGVRVPGGADGQYGQATAVAVSQYQAARGLPATGVVDALTAALLAGGAPVAPSSTSQSTPSAPSTPATGLPAPGASGSAVLSLQRQLIAVGARPKGGADGVYGAATVSAVKVFQRWMGITATGVLDRATADALTDAAGVAAVPPLNSFPVPSTCAFWDTWGAPRSGGRVHHGVDIFASKGTPVYAVEDGRISQQLPDFPGSIGGNQEWLRAKDGSRYFYGHLSGFAKGVGLGSPVRAGDVIGYAGATGLTTVSHLHFEIHPGGGPAVNPYPVLRAMAGC